MGYLVETDEGYIIANDVFWGEMEQGQYKLRRSEPVGFNETIIFDVLTGPRLSDLLNKVLILGDESMEVIDAFKDNQNRELEIYRQTQESMLQLLLKAVGSHGHTASFDDIRQE